MSYRGSLISDKGYSPCSWINNYFLHWGPMCWCLSTLWSDCCECFTYTPILATPLFVCSMMIQRVGRHEGFDDNVFQVLGIVTDGRKHGLWLWPQQAVEWILCQDHSHWCWNGARFRCKKKKNSCGGHWVYVPKLWWPEVLADYSKASDAQTCAHPNPHLPKHTHTHPFPPHPPPHSYAHRHASTYTPHTHTHSYTPTCTPRKFPPTPTPTHTPPHAHTHILPTHTDIHTHPDTPLHSHTHSYTPTHSQHTHMYTPTYMHAHIYTYPHTHIHTHTGTPPHTHTHMHPGHG